MIDKFDYLEPSCSLCEGREFYHPKKDDPIGRIPVSRIIDKVDSLFDKNDYIEAGKLLVYWQKEAVNLRDRNGELAILSELIGFYRKQSNRDEGLKCITRALVLVRELEQQDMASGATVYINCATAYKAFGEPEKAMPLYEKAEQIYKHVLPEFDPRFGGLYNNMALTLVDIYKIEKAEEAYFKAISVMEKAENGELESAITYINLAHMYDEKGRKEKAADCMETALKLLQSEALPRDGYYAFVLEKCAPSFGYFGDVVTYEKLIKESKDIYARS